MRIILDMDSILADIETPWLAECNRRFGDNLTVADITTWDLHKLSKGGKKVYDILGEEGFFRRLEPIPGALVAAELLAGSHDVHVVTACEFPFAAKEKVEWFHEHLPFLGKRRLWIGHEKHMLKADVIVDDGPHNAVAYRAAHPDALIMTIGYGYNKDCPAYDLIAGDFSDARGAWAEILERLL
jgi:5'-nucleotidase